MKIYPGSVLNSFQKMKSFPQLQSNIISWAYQRGILDHSTARAQLLKAFSEMGELADADIKGNDIEKLDAIGDVLVCLTIYAEMNGMTLHTALAVAWDAIKDRKGRTIPGGAFVKERE